jgi:hypothetical protein
MTGMWYNLPHENENENVSKETNFVNVGLRAVIVCGWGNLFIFEMSCGPKIVSTFC